MEGVQLPAQFQQRPVRRFCGQDEIEPDLVIADYHLDDGLIGLDAIDAVRKHCGLPVPGIVHIEQPYPFELGAGMDPAEFGLQQARLLEDKILELGADKVAAFDTHIVSLDKNDR